MSGIRKLTGVLVTIRFLPLKVENTDQCVFRMRSRETFLSFIFYVVCFSFLYITCSFLFFKGVPNTELLFQTVDMTDFLTQTGFSVSNILLYPFLPLIMAKAASRIPELSLHPSLPWPRIGWKVVVCECLTFVGYLLNIGPTYLHFGWEAFQKQSTAVFISVTLAVIVTAYIVLCYLVSQLLVLSWLDQLGILVHTVVQDKMQDHARSCLALYHKLNQALGFYFFFIFATQQFAWVFSLYLSLSFLLHSDPDLIDKLHGSFALLAVKSGGMFLLSISCLLHLYHLVTEVENLRDR